MRPPSHRDVRRAVRWGIAAVALTGGVMCVMALDLLTTAAELFVYRVDRAVGVAPRVWLVALPIALFHARALAVSSFPMELPADPASAAHYTPRRRSYTIFAYYGWLAIVTLATVGVVADLIASLLRSGFHVPGGLVLGPFAALLISALVGVPVGGGAGLLGAIASGHATTHLHAVRKRPTLDAPARIASAVGLTVLVPATVAGLLSLWLEAPVSGWVSVGLAAPALVAVVHGAVTRRHLEVLDASVREPRDDTSEGWARVPLSSLDSPDLLPLHRGIGEAPAHALVRLAPAGDGAYRDTAIRIPWALVD
ncbi:MAG: hypothetical protein SangKO_032380 [Sandaracinaceae bacterium]